MAYPSKQSVRAVSNKAQQAAAILRKEKKEPSLSPAAKEAVELMVFEGRQRKEAAELVGIQDDSLRKALTKPDVLAYLNQCMEVLRTSERPRSLLKVVELRDKAGSERVQLDAAKYIDGMDRGVHQVGATVINNTQINNTVNVTPGYVIRIDRRGDERGQQIEHLRAHDANGLLHNADVPGDE